MIAIRDIAPSTSEFGVLQHEAREEGYGFVDLTVQEWSSGANRFDGPGECFCGCFEQDVLIAIGGLTRDPFLEDPKVGRLRRIYVRAGWRNRGVGRLMVEHLLGMARKHFRAVRLRAEDDRAARLYQALGFRALADPEATHVLGFREADASEA